jgi:hypothetical protein
MNLEIIVLDQLQPPSLMHVQISMSENVLQALMVGEDMNHIPKKIVPPCPQDKNNHSQFKIMHGIVFFMTAQLSLGIHNHTTVLHKNTAKPSARSVTTNIERLHNVWLC